jgi:hypothetical protein
MVAMTLGNNIHFKEGKFNPRTLAGITLLAHEIAHAQQYRGLGTGTFLQTYVGASVATVSSPAGLVATMIAAAKGVNLPHDANIYELAAQAKAAEVRDYLASKGYGEQGMTCLQ